MLSCYATSEVEFRSYESPSASLFFKSVALKPKKEAAAVTLKFCIRRRVSRITSYKHAALLIASERILHAKACIPVRTSGHQVKDGSFPAIKASLINNRGRIILIEQIIDK